MKGLNKMWTSDTEHIHFLANEVGKLEKRAINNGFYGFLGGFFSGIGAVALMWLLHR